METRMIKLISIVLVSALGLTTEVAKADFTFGEPTNLGPAVNSSNWDLGPSIPADGLTLYFTSNRSGGYGSWDLWVATRATKEDDWGTPVNLGPTVNSSSPDISSVISSDGLSFFFGSNRPGGSGNRDIWVTTRATTEDDWGTPVNLGPTINSSNWDNAPSISADGLSLYFDSGRAGGYGGTYNYGDDIYVTTRATTDDAWGTPVNLGPTVNGPADDGQPCISPEGLTLFFSNYEDGLLRPDGLGGADIWVTTRSNVSDAWGTPVNLGPAVNSSADDATPYISADGLTLYFSSRRPGGYGNYDIWQASIIPIVDFNGDGIVDSVDMCTIVDHWGESYSLCDIGPTPLGDGTVDVEDIKILAEHLFKEVDDPTLVAHWALDETEGMFAADSVSENGVNDAVVIGGIEWQPAGGQIDGALKLDGVSGYAIAGAALNPADGPFSVLAWIKGGAPGQVVISQQFASNWLAIDTEGNLMTELKGAGRSTGPLFSEAVVTDGQWHRIGLIWDGSNRTLYIDGVAVAEDTQPNLEGSQMGLCIGTGKTMEAGTFFSGLIDDVRIYDRVVSP